LLDTHYYGGIKKYQWVTLPLAIHGVVCKTDGTTVKVTIGEDAGDPAFVITDLLPHLGDEQMKRNAAKVVEGEDLDVLVGSWPAVVDEDDESDEAKAAKKEPVKARLLALLKEKYDIEEEDFMSAELEVVPAGRARECGFDRSMVLGYGQDDRSCAYTSLVAQLEAPARLRRTGICLLVDKEEIGSIGATGMESLFIEDTLSEILYLAGYGDSHLALRRCLKNTQALSCDVAAAYDPSFPNVFETKNAAFMGRGLVVTKFTGRGGKSGANDADAEFVALVRRVLDDANVAWQTAELGRVDAGGGGTVAFTLARYGMQVIDAGVAVLSMHAPWEVISKADLYESYRGYVAWLAHA
jgi:aspartyl aminopeptidase